MGSGNGHDPHRPMTTPTARRSVRLEAKQGLHTRPAARLMETARRFAAEVHLVHGAQRASAKELLDVLFLAAPAGTTIEIEAVGPDAEVAAEAIAAFLRDLREDA
jgi:phosphotransferase system HPr (HPr) family protein